tara:strand:- start:5762 stop:5887 length:126 start_codon:yes stop_codon:yes gene_type:complete
MPSVDKKSEDQKPKEDSKPTKDTTKKAPVVQRQLRKKRAFF